MKLALHGYGKMGKAVEKIARESGHEVVAIFTSSKKPTLNGAEVMIDFSQTSGVDEAVALACDDHVDLVIGTTGWNDRVEEIRKRIDAAGIADGFSPPGDWNVAQNKNVRWKTAIAGLGLSSPVVWGDLLCVTSAISGQKDAGIKPGLYGDIDPVRDDTTHEWRIVCLQKNTGAVVWQRTTNSGRALAP